jgi:hypothetical protein
MSHSLRLPASPPAAPVLEIPQYIYNIYESLSEDGWRWAMTVDAVAIGSTIQQIGNPNIVYSLMRTRIFGLSIILILSSS